MKSERRHDLKANSLARGLQQLPELGRKHGVKILLAFIVLLLVVVLVRQRIITAREKAQAMRSELASAQSAVAEMGNIDAMLMSGKNLSDIPQQLALQAQGIEDAVNQVLASANDPGLKAQALVVQGDLNWQLANLPDLPGATTKPAFKASKAEFLSRAAKAYQQVIEQYPKQSLSAIRATFGLAAVKESQQDWDAASKLYEKITSDANIALPFQNQARARADQLGKLQQPVWIGSPASQPTTAPAGK